MTGVNYSIESYFTPRPRILNVSIERYLELESESPQHTLTAGQVGVRFASAQRKVAWPG